MIFLRNLSFPVEHVTWCFRKERSEGLCLGPFLAHCMHSLCNFLNQGLVKFICLVVIGRCVYFWAGGRAEGDFPYLHQWPDPSLSQPVSWFSETSTSLPSLTLAELPSLTAVFAQVVQSSVSLFPWKPFPPLSTPFKLFLMTSYYCKCFMLFGIFQIYQLCLSFLFFSFLSFLAFNDSILSQISPNLCSIYSDTSTGNPPALSKHLAVLSWFLRVHFTPSLRGTSSVYGPGSSWVLFVMLWVTSQLTPVPSLRALFSVVL